MDLNSDKRESKVKSNGWTHTAAVQLSLLRHRRKERSPVCHHCSSWRVLSLWTQLCVPITLYLCIHVHKSAPFCVTPPSTYTHTHMYTHTRADWQYKSILIHLDEVLLFSNISGVVPVTWSTQALLCSPLIPPIILLEGQRPINHNEMFQREACKVCGCLGEEIFVLQRGDVWGVVATLHDRVFLRQSLDAASCWDRFS